MNTLLTTAAATKTISISGYPLIEPVTIRNACPDDSIHGSGWMLSLSEAVQLLNAWKQAPTDHSDVLREWRYSASGLFATALYLDEDISLSFWESTVGSDGTDRYSTETMPFDFEVQETPR